MAKTKDEVGYGKPPKATQFQKGKSGNPTGRPKGHKDFKSLSGVLRELALKEVQGQMNGKPSKLTCMEAIVAKQMSAAMQGNIPAAKFIMGLIEKHVPMNLSIQELMEDKPVFSWTAEDERRISKENLLAGVTVTLKPTDEK
jgi:uncharacterized protein DUF5681